jgi:hypothetical protein
MTTIISRAAAPVGVAFLVAVVATFAATAEAAIMTYEALDYSGIPLVGQNGGIGWNGAWAQTGGTTSPNTLSDDGVSLSYPVPFESPLTTPAVSGSRLKTGSTTNNASSTRLFNDTLNLSVGGNVRYASALFRKNAPNDAVTTDNVLIEFFDSGGNRRWGFGIEGGDKPWINTNASGTGATSVVPSDTYFLVAKIVSNVAPTVDVASLYVFGTGYGSQVPLLEPLTADATASTNTAAILDRVRFRVDTGNTTALPGEIDQFRMGSTWADVVGSEVPEPTCVALVSLAALAGMARRRNR